MENMMKEMISAELKQFHCSILLDEVKEKVRKLRRMVSMMLRYLQQ